jgi:hypothetical protein
MDARKPIYYKNKSEEEFFDKNFLNNSYVKAYQIYDSNNKLKAKLIKKISTIYKYSFLILEQTYNDSR